MSVMRPSFFISVVKFIVSCGLAGGWGGILGGGDLLTLILPSLTKYEPSATSLLFSKEALGGGEGLFFFRRRILGFYCSTKAVGSCGELIFLITMFLMSLSLEFPPMLLSGLVDFFLMILILEIPPLNTLEFGFKSARFVLMRPVLYSLANLTLFLAIFLSVLSDMK